MARAHFVKSARKNYPDDGIKKGESYWWWAFMVGGRGGAKHRSKKQPKPSQLTQSEFMSTVLGIEEDLSELSSDMTVDEIRSAVDDAISQLETLHDETQDKFDNMPEGLQQGDTGQLLESRVESVEEMKSELEGIDYGDAEEAEKAVENGDTTKNKGEEGEGDDKEGDGDDKVESARQDLINEIQGISYGGE